MSGVNNYLPTSKNDMYALGWDELDIILVTGDAYVDHPSYGTALIGRVLEREGFRVGIIAQPDWHNVDAFKALGKPKLFFGVTAGNLDSMIANYTANKKVRNIDDYSPGGKSHLRPDRASIIYANKLQQAYKGAVIILGGMEASMRRLAHYDYWSDKVRRSILLDAKCDMLVYGMGEKQMVEIAHRLQDGENIHSLDNIRGTVVARKDIGAVDNAVIIPSFEDVSTDKHKFNMAFKDIYAEADPLRGRAVVQKHADRFVVQYPPAMPMTTEELDNIYSLPFVRDWHTSYDKSGGIPGFESVRNSITSHRGCAGGCSFCSLYLHQGRHVQSRSIGSILEEIRIVSQDKTFKGTITDIGGPTANMYMAKCSVWKDRGACREKKCLVPEVCRNFKLGYGHSLELWKKLKTMPNVKHVFVGSGVRYDLLTESYSDEYLHELCAHHVSGQLKTAPEHCANHVLDLMNKPRFNIYKKFTDRFEKMNRKLNKKQFLVNYFIVGHPGARLQDALQLALYLAKNHINPEQVQDFIPLPMTLSGAMYHTEQDPFTGKKLYVAKYPHERMMQRALLQYKNPQNRHYILKALKILDKEGLKKALLG